MSLPGRDALRTVEVALALGVLLVVGVLWTNFPVEYPSWPKLWGIPVDPELVVPGTLGVAVLVDAVTDGLEVWSVVVGALGALTAWLAASSLYALYAGRVSGVFFGGLFTLAVGVPLALLVLGRWAFDAVDRRRRGTAGDTR